MTASRILRALVGSAALALAMVAALSGSAGAASETRSVDCGGTIALTRAVGVADVEAKQQVRWARLAITDFNAAAGTSFTSTVFKTRGDAATAKSAAMRIAGSSAIGMVGFQTSGETLAGGPTLDRAGIAYVSASATRTSLTDGSLPGFFRVVPPDSLQGPLIASYIAKDLHGRNVVIVDQGEAYSTDLAASIAKTLKARGVAYTRLRIAQGAADYATEIAAMPADVDVVALPVLQVEDANRFAADLRSAGRSPKLIGGDGTFSSELTVPGMAVTSFLADLNTSAFGRAVAARYKATYGPVDETGATAYTAARMLLSAAVTACRANGHATRAGVLSALPTTRLAQSIFGRPVAFTATHDVRNGRMHIWVQNADGTFDFVC